MSLRHAILGFLSIRPLSGYDLKRAFDSSVRHFWSADQAAIYRALAELERDGFVAHERVAQAARPDRKVHQLTGTGHAELLRWMQETTPMSQRREPLLVKLFFAGPLGPDAVRAIVDAELAQVEEELQAFTAYASGLEQRALTAGADERRMLLGPVITLTNGLQLGRAYRDWLATLAQHAASGTLTLDAMLDELRRQREG